MNEQKPSLGRPRKYPKIEKATKLVNYPPEQKNGAKLIEALKTKLNLTTDGELGLALGMSGPAIKQIKVNALKVDIEMLFRMNALSNMSFREMRELMA